MTDAADEITLETEMPEVDAEQEIAEAVSGRHALARRYVRRLRRSHPDATPADVIQLLERHYAVSIATAGAAISVGTIAASVAIGMIPLAGGAATGAKVASKQVAKAASKHAVKSAAKQAAKGVALSASKTGAQRIAGLLPAGEQQLQFELTAIYGLALAEIHGIEYDRDQAHALVYGLTNERVSQQQIAKMAADVAQASSDSAAVAHRDPSQWATTLSDALPGGAARSLVQTMQTGQLDAVRDGLTGKHQAAVDYGVAAVSGGIDRFRFGREVIESAQAAFPDAPPDFPEHLRVADADEDTETEPNRALAALEEAARATRGWVAGAAGTVGSGVVGGARAATGMFRSVDLNGDGVPDEARALTAVKGAGGAVTGAAGAVGGRVAGLFKRGKGEQLDEASDAASITEHLSALAELRDRGVLTDEEFSAKKSDLLARI